MRSWVPSKLDKVNFKGRENTIQAQFSHSHGWGKGLKVGKNYSQSMMMGFLLLGRREGGGKKNSQSPIDDGLPLTRARGEKNNSQSMWMVFFLLGQRGKKVSQSMWMGFLSKAR